MAIDAEETLARLDAGRKALAARLRDVADKIESLPLDDVAEVLCWMGDDFEQLLRRASLFKAVVG